MAHARKKPITEPDPYDTTWLIGRIRDAGPLAGHLLWHGLADESGDLVGQLMEFTGDTAELDLVDGDRDYARVINWISQAFAVGIAVGQRLQPGSFHAKGGAR